MENKEKLRFNGQEYDCGVLADSGAIILQKGDKFYLLCGKEQGVKEVDSSHFYERIYDGPASQYDIDNYQDYEFYKK